MAVPLAATLQPIETPYKTSVAAEVLVQYDGTEAYDVDVGYYFNDPASIESIEGGVGSYRECYTPAITSDGCSILVPTVSSGGFQTVVGASIITFSYVDVADFFWYEPDGTGVTEISSVEAVQWGAQCTAAEAAVLAACHADDAAVGAACHSDDTTAACSSSAMVLNPDGSIA